MVGFRMSASDYVDFLVIAGKEIEKQGDYITALDAKTGDGDHWVNLNEGFQKIILMQDELKKLSLAGMLQKTGMILMSSIGGSSGILYGCAYLAAAKELKGVEDMDIHTILRLLDVQLRTIMERGKTKPGWKTMVDSLYEGVEALKKAIDSGSREEDAINALKKGAQDGMEHTKDMEAVRGRASYQSDKGVGSLDPGAVTMCIQLQCLGRFLQERKIVEGK